MKIEIIIEDREDGGVATYVRPSLEVIAKRINEGVVKASSAEVYAFAAIRGIREMNEAAHQGKRPSTILLPFSKKEGLL